jgi:hypothetical protein
MYVCVCMHVCMYVYVCICMGVCVYICMYVCMHVCMCMYVCMYVWVCVCVYMHVCVYVCMYACMCVYMYVCVYIYMHVYLYACMYVCMYACICACVYVWMYYYYYYYYYYYTACSITSCNTTCLERSLCTCIQYLHFNLTVHINAVAVRILFCLFWSDLLLFVVLFEASYLIMERKRNTLILHRFDLLQLFIVNRLCEMSDLF